MLPPLNNKKKVELQTGEFRSSDPAVLKTAN